MRKANRSKRKRRKTEEKFGRNVFRGLGAQGERFSSYRAKMDGGCFSSRRYRISLDPNRVDSVKREAGK